MTLLALTALVVSSTPDVSTAPYFEVTGGAPGVEAMPLEKTSVSATLAGVIARVTVKQTYRNRGVATLHTRYVFPASTRAAVHGLVMRVGERQVRAVIQERHAALKQFEAAKAQGKTASLLEQDRPNVFTMNLANVLPNDVVEVTLEYSELLLPERGQYEWVFPTVVGPRYVNGSERGATTFAHAPYLRPGAPVQTTLELDGVLSAGMTVHSFESPSHRLTSTWQGLDTVRFRLSPEAANGTKDVVVRYGLQGAETASGLLLSSGDENFFLLTVQPPARVAIDEVPPRDYVFVVDVSGSMHGFPLDTTRALVVQLLRRLRPTDTFNILFFSGGSTTLAERPLPATAPNIARAEALLTTFDGSGGTELLPALTHALALPRPDLTSRSIVVVTDGYVGCEREAFTLIEKNLSRANLFAFGIGSSVNRHLIEGLAHAGRGEPFFVLDPREGAPIAERFRQYIETPVLTGVQLELAGFDAYDVEPLSQPDVFAERPIVVTGKWRGPKKGTITVRGANGRGTWSKGFALTEVAAKPEHAVLGLLWARERVRRVSDFAAGSETPDDVAAITELGLRYGLLTAHTSFVAVLEEVRATERGVDVVQPVPLPSGVSALAVGDVARGDEPAVLIGLAGLLIAVGLVVRRRRAEAA